MSIIQALAMTVAEIPVFLDTTFGQSTFLQLRLSPGLRKVLFASALGTVALALAAHQLKRHKHKKKQITAGNGGLKLGGVPGSVLPVRRSSSAKKVHILATQAVSWSSKGPFWHGSWYGRPSPGCTPAKTAQAQEEADYSRQWRPKARRGAWLCFAR
ncbi:mitoguardin 2 [Xenopus tropicalis]|uniref:Mitoguardin 2 n=2 Tax=Xenopus tropicalis TaxID=8364 RepID=A0A8J1IMM9_XENTR|nr:mitoguardin 2 [Xenopus tropicalis]XP_031746812.1 mitoguardin 2 [Xenopus tropicalis]XP_031746813.1 mitoguardin 2 [Xenopus tropicalis]XP_031746814.1 mitoguardin 2 [Xenopus tropicalis]